MARISQDQVQERHAFLLELFRSQPELSRQEAMEAYKDRFGASLNAKTFNELREQAQRDVGEPREVEEKAEESEPSEQEQPVEDTATRLRAVASSELMGGASSQPAKKPKAKGGTGPKNVFVDATAEQLPFLARVVMQRQEAGAHNVRIDYATDRWMVLAVDGK
ncbi:MAG TPA: hypothetical protein VLQ93_03435 [Myxococcaceae bacterium]|nr:hypothetical protein [Myxococcaceae bacterium]